MIRIHLCYPVIALSAALFPLTASQVEAQDSPKANNTPYGTAPMPATAPAEGYQHKMIPHRQLPMPFAVDEKTPSTGRSYELLTDQQISADDRELAAHSMPAIRDEAELSGIDFSHGDWTRQQLVCPVLPGHMFLIYRSDRGVGDTSLFSVAIPRGNKGRVSLIPIARRGYTPYSTAAVNSATVGAFNRIRAEEPPLAKPDWLATGLCYAALAGARPQASPAPDSSASTTMWFPPKLEIGGKGESTVRFVDLGEPKHPMQWTLAFDPSGHLLQVARFPTPVYRVTPIPASKLPQPAPQTHQ